MSKNTSNLRIIGGKWRSRKIKFIPLKGLRPTTDMTRETLFNWLTPHLPNANCLDLFTGSGALGFESLSRGAKHVVMVDKSKKVVAQLKLNAELLETKDADLYCLNIPEQLNKIPEQSFDIIFIDPPFQNNLLESTCEKLAKSGYIAKNATIYIEAEKSLNIKSIIPKNWEIAQQKSFGAANIYLLTIN